MPMSHRRPERNINTSVRKDELNGENKQLFEMELEASMDFSMDGALYTYHSYFSITKPSKQLHGEQI